jgi:serine/threonine protein kinase
MPTPLPAKKPGASKDEARENEALASRTSAKLEPPDPSQAATLEPGTIIAERYRIDALLGEGGMGKVYSAEHVHMRKQVAIKVLHPEMSTTPEVVARFEREAVAAGKITHPNVAAATDFGRLEDRSFFLVLEYVKGVDLRAVLRQGPVPKERALHILRQITAAVGAAHAAGVIHRDLKPENIMLVERDGEADFVKVLDFGIAKIDTVGIADAAGAGSSSASGPSPAQPLTKMGAVFGTPDYMSPEQALGQPTDARSDLYSLGVMLYELLTGERPFKGGAVTLMRKQVLEDAPALPPATLESVGAPCDAIIQKLMKKSASDRYASAAELLSVLAELEETPGLAASMTMPVGSRPAISSASLPSIHGVPGESGEPSDAVPRKKPRYGVALLTMVALGVGGLYWLGLSPRSLFLDMLSGKVPTASPLPAPPSANTANMATAASAPVASASSASTTAAEPSVDTPVASDPNATAAPFDSAAPVDSEELTVVPAPEESATTAATAPHHSGPHVTQPHPTSKPIHKKSYTAPRQHSGFYIPPPSQWLKGN